MSNTPFQNQIKSVGQRQSALGVIEFQTHLAGPPPLISIEPCVRLPRPNLICNARPADKHLFAPGRTRSR
jgi:hypothetical protein